MKHSLEVRVPFLDHHLVNWCFGLKQSHRLANGVGKRALKHGLKSRLPEELLYRNKMGFSVPLKQWTRGPLKRLVDEALTGERINDTGWFDKTFLRKVSKEHSSAVKDHSTLIWSLMMFDAFLKKHDTYS